MNITKWILMSLCGVLALAGCGSWPPVTDTAKDVRRLPSSTEHIRARALPDEDYESLRHLPQLNYLDLHSGWGVADAEFSDRGLATLASLKLPNLETVFFGHCVNVTDASLVHIQKLKTVTFLGLVACPNVTDTGLRRLADMENLRELDLRACPNITDKGLVYLASHTHWDRIEFGGCPQITHEAVADLQRKYPNAHIEKDNEEWSHHSQ